MASRRDAGWSTKDKLETAVREALTKAMGKRAPEMVDDVTEAMMEALRGQFAIGVRRPRPRRETARALSMRLPVGVEFTHRRKGKVYTLRVVNDRAVDLECEGEVTRYESLKAVATAILGYAPSVGGWQFFFGTLDYAEVVERYGKKS